MKKLILYFIFLFFIYSVSSVTFSMSPPQLDLNPENNCGEVHLEVDKTYSLIGRVLWADEGYMERKLVFHNLSSEETGIKIDYPKNLDVDENKTIQVCINSSEGNYHGILLYRVVGKPVEVGIWLNSSFGKVEKKSFILTGKSISGEEKTKINGFVLSGIVLALILFGLIFINNRKARLKKNNSLQE